MRRLFRRLFDLCTGRWYALYVSGHGSGFIREKELLTRKEVLQQADHWEGFACTIGGRSVAKNVYTGEVIYPVRPICPR